MKPIAVRITDQYISRVANVNPVREVCYILTADATQKLTFLVEYDDAVPFEVTDEEFLACAEEIDVGA